MFHSAFLSADTACSRNMICLLFLSCLFGSKVRAYDNIALGKPAWPLNPFSSTRWGADLAVDGRKSDLSAHGGQCTISHNDKQTAKWWVDLGSVHSIHHITIYPRTENSAWDPPRLLGFSVYISNTNNTEDGVLCSNATMYTKDTIPSTPTLTCPGYGRYVIYYNERLQNVTYPAGYSKYAFNDLCEVEVYGCATPGFYGENCNRRCPQYCKERQCDIVTGTCLGCIPGYKGPLCKQHNIALGKPAWQLNPYSSTRWGADLAVDGRKSDLSAGGGQCTISANNKQTAKWWVDLGDVLSIHHITIYARTDNRAWDPSMAQTGRLLGFSVYISNTNNTEDEVLCFKDTMYTNATVPNTTTLTCPGYGRYVIYYNERLKNVTYPAGYSKYAFNDLCEVEVYGCATLGFYGENCNRQCSQFCKERHCDIVTGTCLGCIPGYKGPLCKQHNIALGKPSWQLNLLYSTRWGADLAVDGRKSDLSANGGQCMISDNDTQTAKWWVDLGSVHSIHHITIYLRTDNLAWDPYRLLGFSVYISNTNNTEDGVLCSNDTMYTRDTIPSTSTITCPGYGRYVIYYNERLQNVTYPAGYSKYAFNELCEVEVYGCATPGFYGENCSRQCSQYCKERHCDIVTGTCLGCIPGYTGPLCKQQCLEGWFSYNCQLHPALYGLAAGFGLSVVLNIYVIVRNLRDKKHQSKNQQSGSAIHEDSDGYQEFYDLRQQSSYGQPK